MSMRVRCSLLVSVVVLSAGYGFGQQGAPVAPPTGRVYLDVVVEPKAGSPVTGLEQKDFTVLDNKVSQPITSFTARNGPEAPVEVILVLDTVNAGYQTVAFARDELKKFLLSNGGELAAPTTLAVLTDKGVDIQPGFSRDGRALDAGLDKYVVGLRSIRRSAGFYGAEERLQLSLNGLGQLTAREAAKPGRKIMVWVSPGWPLLSGPRVELSPKEQDQLYQEVTSLATQLRSARVTVYSVDPLGSSAPLSRTQYYKEFVKGVTKPSQVLPGDLALQVLATQTGGLALASSNDIAGLLKQAVDDTKAFYEISFDQPASDRPGEYHRLEVQVAKPNVMARTRQGYYAQP